MTRNDTLTCQSADLLEIIERSSDGQIRFLPRYTNGLLTEVRADLVGQKVRIVIPEGSEAETFEKPAPKEIVTLEIDGELRIFQTGNVIEAIKEFIEELKNIYSA